MADLDDYDFRDVRLDDVDEEWLRGLIGMRENDFLDVKSEMYGNGESKRRELAADVTALANASGGLIVVGALEEDEIVSELVPLPVGGEERRVRQILASNVSPYLADTDVAFVPAAEAESVADGYLLIAVKASTEAPHAVVKGKDHRFPVRDGSTTRYMGTSEVARAIRLSMQTATERRERSKRLLEEVRRHQDSELRQAWLTLSFVPARTGTLRISAEEMVETHRWWQTVIADLPHHVRPVRTTTSSNRFTIGDFAQHRGKAEGWFPARSMAVDLWLDGSIAITTAISAELKDSDERHFIFDEWLATRLIGMLQLAASHFARAGSSGSVEVTAEVCSDSDMILGHSRRHFNDPLPNCRTINNSEVVHLTLDHHQIVASPTSRVAAGSVVGDALVNCFGVTQLEQFTSEGVVRLKYFGITPNNWRKYIEPWCEKFGVPTDQKG